jgi:hypothetical protein
MTSSLGSTPKSPKFSLRLSRDTISPYFMILEKFTAVLGFGGLLVDNLMQPGGDDSD